MAQLIAERRDIDFVLYEQIKAQQLLKYKPFNDFTRKMFDMVVSEARTLGIKEILPTYAQGDREGVRFEAGTVKIPECFRRPHKLFVEGEWIALSDDPEYGGQGLPHTVAQAAYEYLIGANFAFTTYGTLGHGAGKMIELFGTDEQKDLFLKKLYYGEWGGTMLLTEPQAGSDVGALTTTAVKNPDGTYAISGNKIFITNGEQNLTPNIIHPVLARVEGAPDGTKGISLFIVPKIWVNADGSLGEPNDVVCTGIEEKMGLHASPTCSLTLGGQGMCRGYLLGQENQGMAIMFHMMNEARLDVGRQGFSHGSTAYLHALEYARKRLQGRDLSEGKNPAAPQVPIIQHPDVRRMLMEMKAKVAGMRSFIYYVAMCFDREFCTTDGAERRKYKALTELLTPLVKAYCSERGMEICDQAIQVYGGYGYTREYPVEQLMRDCKITTIYEGTNGIQAMDLLGRKLRMDGGAAFTIILSEIDQMVDQARGQTALAGMADGVEAATQRLKEVATLLGRMTASPEFKVAFAHAHPFLTVMGDVIMGWMHLWRAVVAAPRLEQLLTQAGHDDLPKLIAKSKEAAFYDGQLKTASFYIESVLPATLGRMDAIAAGNAMAVAIDEKSFGG